MTVSQRLCEWAFDLRPELIPEAVRRAALLHVLDGFGTAVAARIGGDAQPAIDVATALAGPAEASVIGSPVAASSPAAALANGVLIHAADFDDTHAGGLVHPTAVVLPALLAVGQQYAVTGTEALTAAVAGYETVCRIGAASPHGFHERGLHATLVCGVFSAALVAVQLAGEQPEVAASALGIAGSYAGGLLEFLGDGSSTKQLHPGMASLNGLLAARLAAAGATGPTGVFEGPRGLFAALSGRPAKPEGIVADLGTHWETIDIGFKPYPSCQLMHVTLDALSAVVDQVDDVGQIREVVAHVHPDSAPTVSEPAAAKIAPRTSYDAKFSLPWSVAAFLVDGSISVETYSPDSIARPEVKALSAKVRTVLMEGADHAADASGLVELKLTDGREVTGRIERSRGTSGAPLSEQEITEKFEANCGEDANAKELAARILDLESESSLHAVMEAARRIVEEARK